MVTPLMSQFTGYPDTQAYTAMKKWTRLPREPLRVVIGIAHVTHFHPS